MRRSGGFTYLALLFFVAFAGAFASIVGVIWSTESQRNKEQQLIYVGEQYRRAIKSYYEQSPGAVKRYPRELSELLLDQRQAGIVRHLRRIYPDPITNSFDWGIVREPDGGIMGIFSKSSAVPVRARAEPSTANTSNTGRTYASWQFIYLPATQESPEAVR